VVAELTTLENKRQIVFKSRENSGEQILQLVINDMEQYVNITGSTHRLTEGTKQQQLNQMITNM